MKHWPKTDRSKLKLTRSQKKILNAALKGLPTDRFVKQKIHEEVMLEIQRCPQTRQSVNGRGDPITLQCVKIEDHDGAHSYLNILSITTPTKRKDKRKQNAQR